MNDVGTTTGELVCEVRVNGFDVARLPRVLAAADRYAAAWQAHVRADVVHDAASRDYEDGIGGAAAGDAQHALIDAASRLLAALCTELEAARIDAELARRYRAAWEAREALAPAYRASLAKQTPPVDISGDELTPEERAWFDADAAVHGALDDLRRGEL